MRPISTYLLAAGLFFSVFQVAGQPLITTFTPASANAGVGGTISLQLKVQNFTNIQSLQFPITFNSAVLQFNSITNPALPGFAPSNYNASTGKVAISWYPDLGLYPNGFTIADNSTIFTVNFTVIANGTSTVNLANTSPGIEVIRNNNPIQVNFGTGGTNVTGGSGGPGPLMGFHVLSNTIYIQQGQTACMPVKVHDFNKIVSMAYAMHWDPTVLQFQSTQNFNLPDLAASNFNLYPAGSNNLLLSWYETALTGITRTNGATIYDVCFKAVGQPGSQTMITIDGNGFPPGGGGAEVINLGGMNVWQSDSGVSDTIFVVSAPPPPDAVTFHADSIDIPKDETDCVDVRVKNFSDVISVQFGITYDANLLTFKNFQFGSNPLGLSNANFNANIPGEIKFTWFDQNAVGVDLADNTLIFSICFEAKGDTGKVSQIKFTGLPGFAVEVVKEPQGEVIPNLQHGQVKILGIIPPMLQLNPSPASCNSTPTGAIAAKLIQGANPISYTWMGGTIPSPMTTMDSVLTGLGAGTYTVTVTVAGGLTATATTTINQPQALSIQSAVPTNTSCFNGQNGSIAITPTGGTSPYTYAWSTGANTKDISGLKAGNYTLTITDSKGCKFTTTPPIAVGQPSDISINSANVTLSPVTCFGLQNGAVALPNPTGGTPNYSFSWSGPNGYTASTKNITSLAGGQYTVTISDNNSCTKTYQFTVSAPAAALSVSLNGVVTDSECFGSNNGKACIQASGGTMPYQVSWKLNSPTGQVISTGLCANNLLPGNYVPVVTDNNGCTAIPANLIPVGGPTEPIEINATVTHVKCAGDANGVITTAPTGGNTGNYTIAWTGGLSGTTISNLNGASYVPTVTDAKGCTIEFAAIQVNEPAAINILAADSTVTPQDGLTLGSITIDKVTGGTPPFTFKWSGPGITPANMNQQSPANLKFGFYNLTITDANGCTYTTEVEVKSTNILLLTQGIPTPSCNDDGTITFIIPQGAVQVVSILLAGNTYIVDKDTFVVGNLPSGVYTPTISDGAGNSYTMDNPAIQVGQLQPALAGYGFVEPFDDSKNGSITLNPIPSNANLTYQWTGPNGFTATTSTLMNLDSGTYVVTLTNLTSGCKSVNTFVLKRRYNPFVCSVTNKTQANCLNTPNGSIQMLVDGADGPTYTFQWSGPNGYTATTKDISSLLPGTYTLTVTDESLVERVCPAVNITAISNLAITNVNELSNYGGFQVSGMNICDGKATVVHANGSGAVSVLWSNGGTMITNDKLCGGIYTVTVTDALGCTSVWTDSLTVPLSINIGYDIISDYNGYDISCFGNCDGRVNVSAVGGVPPYKIVWPSGQTDQNLPAGGISQANQMCAGDYTVTITDGNGVTATTVVTVVEPDPLEIEFDATPPSSFSACNAEVEAYAPVGVGNINFTWSTSNGLNGTGPLAENLCSGSYITFVIEDGNNCTAVGRLLVPYPEDGCMRVRPVLTPAQADGNNDYTLITCIESYPDNTFEVYNRWGQLVFQTTGYNNGDRRWEGLTPGGQLLPDGVYFFVLKYKDDNGNDQILKGYINLLR